MFRLFFILLLTGLWPMQAQTWYTNEIAVFTNICNLVWNSCPAGNGYTEITHWSDFQLSGRLFAQIAFPATNCPVDYGIFDPGTNFFDAQFVCVDSQNHITRSPAVIVTCTAPGYYLSIPTSTDLKHWTLQRVGVFPYTDPMRFWGISAQLAGGAETVIQRTGYDPPNYYLIETITTNPPTPVLSVIMP